VGAKIPVQAQAEQTRKPQPTVTTTANRLCCYPVQADDEGGGEDTTASALTAHVERVSYD